MSTVPFATSSDSPPSPAPASPPKSAAPIPQVRGLEAGLVPLREFPLRKWFYSTPLWYYHAPALEHRLRRDPKFYELVDPQLRPLCALLEKAGLFTTPSCQGHFYPRERFEQIWEELRRDAQAITGPGLQVKDSETDAEYLFCDPDYTLAWHTFEDFYRDADAHQNQGYIGVALPPERDGLLERFHISRLQTPSIRFAFDESLSAILGHPLFGFHVSTRWPEERERAWSAATAFLATLLE